MASQLPYGFLQFSDSNGDPLVGGSVAYNDPNSPGTPKPIWGDPGQTIPLQNPVPLDATGKPFSGGSEVGIWGTGQYQMIVRSSSGVLQWSALTAEPLSATGGTINGNLTVNGVTTLSNVNIATGTATLTSLTVNGTSNFDGSVGVVGSLAVSGNTNTGNLGVTGNFSVSGNSNMAGSLGVNNVITAASTITSSAQVIGEAGIFAANDLTFGMVINQGTGERQIQVAPNYFWDWAPGSGNIMEWIGAGNPLWRMNPVTFESGNDTGFVYGNGAYQNISDIRTKEDIRPARFGLSEILRLEPIDFVRKSNGNSDTGFAAQQVQSIIPTAVRQVSDAGLGVADTPIVAALVNAVKELSRELVQMRELVSKLQRPIPDVEPGEPQHRAPHNQLLPPPAGTKR